jgi:hypothetical protein
LLAACGRGDSAEPAGGRRPPTALSGLADARPATPTATATHRSFSPSGRRPPPLPPRDATCRRQRVAVRQTAPSPARLASGLRPPRRGPHVAAGGEYDSLLRLQPLWRGHPARDSQFSLDRECSQDGRATRQPGWPGQPRWLPHKGAAHRVPGPTLWHFQSSGRGSGFGLRACGFAPWATPSQAALRPDKSPAATP